MVALTSRVMQQCVIDGKAVAEPFAVWNFHGSKAFSDGPQTQSLRCGIFLAFDVGEPVRRCQEE